MDDIIEWTTIKLDQIWSCTNADRLLQLEEQGVDDNDDDDDDDDDGLI